MNKLFSYDGFIMRFFEKIFDLMLLHLLWVVFSIPIITIGASTTALISMAMKIIRKEEGYIFRNFIREFKSNFKKSTCIWLVFLVLFIWVIFFIRMSFSLGTTGAKGVALIEASVAFVAFAACKYVFAIQARFENTVFNTIKNAVILSLKNLPVTLLLMTITLLPIFITGYVRELSAELIFFWLFFGEALIAQVDAYFLVRIFKPYEEQLNG